MRGLAFILFDTIAIVIAYAIALLSLHLFGVTFWKSGLIMFILFSAVVKVIVFAIIGTYRVLTKHLDYGSLVKLIMAIMLTNAVFWLVTLLEWSHFLQASAYIFIGAVEAVFLVGYRIVTKYLIMSHDTFIKRHITGKRTLILGAGSAGEIVLKEFLYRKPHHNFVVGFLDDDEAKIGKRIINKSILGSINELDLYIDKYAVEEVVIAINNISKEKETELLNTLNNYPNIKVKKINVLADFNEKYVLKIVDVKVEDLLNREPIDLEIADITSFISGETILVTGGGGSIGSELCRQIFKLKPKQLIIFDIYENNAYDIQQELLRFQYLNKNNDTEIIAIIGSVYNELRLEEVFKQYNPTLIFHAAAYKHVPLMEFNAREAIRTNVIGTYNVSMLANKYQVKKMVLVSSDKAVRSTNVMGATKRYAEVIINYANKIGPTKFSAVRFGNVLGSNGSVIPIFKKQIEDGGPVTVTHKDIVRYFMTIPESVGLILQSAVYAAGGEVFVLDMGKPIKILDLAKKMIYLSGYTPGVDIDIEFTGLRPGEKLYEELLINKESDSLRQTSNARIFIETNINTVFEQDSFDVLMEHFETVSNLDIKKMLAKIVHSYQLNGDENE